MLRFDVFLRALRRPRAWLVAAALISLPLARPAAAAGATPDEDCLMCHSNRELTRESGSRSSVWVNADPLRRSAHAAVRCVQCHGGAEEMPHPARLPKVRCGSCHAAAARDLAGGAHASVRNEKGEGCVSCHGTHEVRPAATMGRESCATCHGAVVEAYTGSVHGVALARGDNEASQCRDCHGPTHGAKRHGDPAAKMSHALQAETCARCHADRALAERRRIPIPAAVELYRNSVHGRSKNPNAAICSDCHESHDLKRATDPTSSIYKLNIPKTCARCHAKEAAEYGESIHGTALAAGVTRSPVCTDCHGEHRIRGPHDPGSPVAASAVTATCSHCHEAAGIRETYGLPAGRLSSYEDSFHGLAARGGSPVVADCASCHGYHRILPSSDPRSDVAPANLPKTCGKCHPGAGERFAAGQVHVVMVRPEEPILHWVRLTYLWLIGLTIGFMSLHQGMHFVKQVQRKFREQYGPPHGHGAGEQWFERMTVAERIQHATLAISFFVLVYTGFALKYPENFLFSWFARLEGGYAWRSLIHRIAAVVMTAIAVYHVIYLFTPRGRKLVRDLLPNLADAGQAMQNVLYLAGLRPDPPKMSRFSYIEKAEYWALVWGTVVMTLTGLALWFENTSLRWFDKWVLDLATIVHYYEAWLAFLAIVVWHLYQNIANPEVYPMNWTWLHGKISEQQMRHEHGLELERLEAEAARAEDEAAAEPMAPPDGAPKREG